MLKQAHVFKGHTAAIYALCDGPDPHSFYTAGGDGLVVHWDLRTPDEGRVAARLGVQLYVLRYLPSEKVLVAGDMSGGVHWVDLGRGRSLMREGWHRGGVFALAEHNGALLSGGGDGKLIRWNIATQQAVDTLVLSSSSLRCLAGCSLRNEWAVGCSDHSLYLLDADTLDVRHHLAQAHSHSVFAAQYAADGSLLFSGGRDAHLKTWQLEPAPPLEIADLAAHLFTVNAVELFDDGAYLATASRDKSIRVWNTSTLELVKVLDTVRDGGHRHSVNRLLWKPHYRQLISVSDDRDVIVWQADPAPGGRLGVAPNHRTKG